MSDFTQQQPQSDIDTTLANLNEQVGEGVGRYLTHLDDDPQADVLTDLQDILVDVISLCTVAYIATDKLLNSQEEQE